MTVTINGSGTISGVTTMDTTVVNQVFTTPKATTTIGVGNATPSASGAGISFPATQSASTDANTLDDYEEGTWTPTLSASPTAPTVTTYLERIGYYTKVGNLVTVHCEIRATLSAAGSAGTARITGLPFVALGGLPAPAIGIRDLLTGTLVPYLSGNVVFLDSGSYVTGGSPYLCFTLSYQVA